MNVDQPENTASLIENILALPEEKRMAVLGAIHVSLADPTVDHGPNDSPDEVQAAWQTEIEQRIADIEQGKVDTVPAEVAEQMIRGDARPNV